ncbi:hypothetical protein [Moritella sp. F3]|uniref:hypothetical protein n=1 Tax=Moritella sp. F3 TaxID=2718882 RepID=UPI0018E1AA23|nr:hypothetical protein [Moritella sp. F3]GIC77638.1 hypothetical protein FMO001_23650 [Moritella sp. F1]GIC82051.1 hypothetical protein FMO003_23320 [Moritella sp. F3]
MEQTTTITVHGTAKHDEIKIIEIPATLRLEVPSCTSDEDIIKLVQGCASSTEGTITGSKSEVITNVRMFEPEQLAKLIKHSDVWVFDLGNIKLETA